MNPPFWLRLLPDSLRRRFEHQPEAAQVASNIAWLASDRVMRLGVGLLIGVWLARHLGPEQFGLLNFGLAFVAILATLGSLGLNGIVVRDLVLRPEEARATLGSAFLVMLAGGMVAFALGVIAVAFVRPGDAVSLAIVAVLGSATVFKASEVVRYWFESRVALKYAVWVENAVFVLLSVLRIAFILGDASLMAFVWLILFESVLVAAGLFAIYVHQGGAPVAWQWRAGRVRELLGAAWPLALSGLTVMIYMRIDQIMLGHMLGDTSVGHFSAAVRISEVWYFLPLAIVSSLTPSLHAVRRDDEALYYRRLQKLFNLMVLISVVVALPMTLLSSPLLTLLFGLPYAPAGAILALHIWAGVFVFLGVVSSQWLVAEGLQHLAFYRTLAGAVVNVVLNLALIPALGGIGAALSTVVSQAIAAYLFDAMNPRTRVLFRMKSRALLGGFLSSPFRRP